jgi:hypothetical protein
LLYDALSNYEWDPLYNGSSVDSLNATVTEAMDLAIPFGLIRKNAFRPTSVLFNFSKVTVLEFIIHDLCHYFEQTLNPCEHGFTTVTSLVTYLDYVTPLVCSQGQVGVICFDLISAFDLVTHALPFLASLQLADMDCLLVT